MDGLPLQEDMDLDDPVESILWSLVQVFEMGGADLLVPVPELRKAAQKLWDRGMRFHPELQASWFHPSATPGLMGSGGEWKKFPPTATGDAAAEAVSRMSPGMRAALLAELEKEGDS